MKSEDDERSNKDEAHQNSRCDANLDGRMDARWISSGRGGEERKEWALEQCED